MYTCGKSVCHSCCNVGDMVILVSHFCPKVTAIVRSCSLLCKKNLNNFVIFHDMQMGFSPV